MIQPIINYWSVLCAAIAGFVLGFLWYGPLFGKQWMKLMKFTPKSIKKMKLSPMTAMSIGFVGTLVTAYVLAHFVDYLEATTIGAASQMAFWLWLGLIAPLQIGVFLWEGKPFKLFLFNTAFNLVTLIVMSSILAVWA